MDVYKAVKQRIERSDHIKLMKTFLLMMNDCLRLTRDLEKPSYTTVKEICYPLMQEYDVHNSYRISAIYESANLLKKYRTDLRSGKASPPYCRRLFISASIGVTVDGGRLVMPDGSSIQLNKHTLSVLKEPGNDLVSATLTPTSLSIIYKRNVHQVETAGIVALDLNLENVTTWDDEGRTEAYSISELRQLQERYRRVTSRFRRRDNRIKREIFRKYAGRKLARRDWVLHELSSLIVRRAAALNQTIAMENLKGIRKIFRRESGSSAYYLSMMNAWPFAELQKQIAYKARWVGLPVVYVEPEGTSSNCSECGGALEESSTGDRMMTCTVCGLKIDRDVNGARRIMSRAVRSAAAGPTDEAMVGGVSRENGPAPKVDAGNPTSQGDWKRGPEHS